MSNAETLKNIIERHLSVFSEAELMYMRRGLEKFTNLQAENEKLKKTNDIYHYWIVVDIVKKLTEYARHKENCAVLRIESNQAAIPCTCGLDDLRKELKL